MPENRPLPAGANGDPDADDDRWYDEYLDAALDGRIEAPESFCARHGVSGRAVRGWIDGIHRLLGHAASRTAPPRAEAHRAPAEPGVPYESLGEFRLLRRLGEGGMGVVFLAEQPSLARLVALKVIRPELAASPTAIERFRTEARAIAKLRHPSIVTVHASGEENGVAWIAMDFLPGRSLAEVLAEAEERRVPIPVTRILRWMADLAQALEAAHTQGVIHRDVKPSNVRITPEDRALLLDFGLARIAEASGPTITRSFLGSPCYASPEQVAGRRDAIDHRTDVYSLGATLYEALTGRPVFEAETLERVLHRILVEEPIPPRRLNRAVPRDLETVVSKAIEKDPARRYATAGAFAEDLARVIELRPVSARPTGPLRRATKWARRNRVAATALVAVLIAAVAVSVTVALRNAAARDDARTESADLAAEAMALLGQYDRGREAAEAAGRDAHRLAARSGVRYLTPEEDATWVAQEKIAAKHLRDREVTFGRVMDLLSQAQRLHPESDGVRDAWAFFYYQRWLDVRGSREAEVPELFRALVRRADRTGEWSRKVAGRVRMRIEPEPADAEIHLFRYREESDVRDDGARRLVACPHDGSIPSVHPGTIALRVVRASGDLAPNDVVLSVGGRAIESLGGSGGALEAAAGAGCTAEAWTGGSLRALVLPESVEVRATAAPILPSAATRLRTSPVAEELLDPGAYLAFVRREGYEDQRVPFHVDHEIEYYSRDLVLRPRLLAAGTTPPGFVYVGCDAFPWDEGPFWIMEREVTAAEYVEFLNADDAGPAASTLPGSDGDRPTTRGRRSKSRWARSADGTFALPRGVATTHPAVDVTCRDAEAYAAWYARRHGLAARGLECGLPLRNEWIRAGKGGDSRSYVHGDRFAPKWVKSRFARTETAIEPVRSFPIDESPYGVYDLMGSAAEWSTIEADHPSGQGRLVLGGSWQAYDEREFRIEAARVAAGDSAEATTGFRLVLRRRGEGR